MLHKDAARLAAGARIDPAKLETELPAVLASSVLLLRGVVLPARDARSNSAKLTAELPAKRSGSILMLKEGELPATDNSSE